MTSSPLKIVELELPMLDEVLAICQHYPQLNWNEAKLKETLSAAQGLGLGLYRDQQLLCFALFNVVLDEAELLVIATLPIERQQGLATQLLQEVQDYFLRRTIHHVFLEVRPSNEAALKLYQHLGFKIINTRKNYYKDGAQHEDALVMELSF